MTTILIVDDDIAVTNYLMVFLMQTGQFETKVVNDSREISDLLSRQEFNLILLDMDMPNVSGMDILVMMHERGIKTPVIILTGVSDVDLAVKSLKLGAFDYLTKPVDEEHLLEVIGAALEHQELRHSISQLPIELKREDLTFAEAFELFPTQNSEMIRFLHQIEKMASSDLDILIWGERGTGKEMLARAIHRASPRREKPFVAVDASGQDPDRFSSALFGQGRVWSGDREERPGFLEEVIDGTLFLGEIEHLSVPMQVRLKRVLQTREYYRENSTQIRKSEARFIVASSCDLTNPAYKGRFHDDLLYHLMVNSVRIPPFRERMEDLPLLADLFLKKALKKIGKEITGFSGEFFDFLRKYDFPDNIQELRNIIEGSVVNEEGSIITIDSLPPYIRSKIASLDRGPEDGFRPRKLEDVQREHIARMLQYYGNDRAQTATELGITLEEMN
ncbi:MAG: sigma-54-dependent Fis family transcriptional regulator, partial [Candidatus Eisenbacteria sp.]|nr:sigma-54-dependent Fis family transcriptional regulator [Candidatus Eisenbacteria bacterium]